MKGHPGPTVCVSVAEEGRLARRCGKAPALVAVAADDSAFQSKHMERLDINPGAPDGTFSFIL